MKRKNMITLSALAVGLLLVLPATSQAQTANPAVMKAVSHLQHEWAHIKYEITDEDAQLDAIHKLEADGEKLRADFPDSPELQIWQGIILSTDAGIVRGISALGKVRDARELFENVIATAPTAMDGSAYTSLGSLYYQVPPWPLAFGSDAKAEENLKKALALNPNGIDPNFFYGDFLRQQERYDEARIYFQKALDAPDRPDRPLADAGRRAEISLALNQMASR
ncbi:tetratricopeptide repeat protein [Thalassospira sp. CH_XMU1458]|uniref:tetratricopeptide repeat protein n=1 Tax=Thalassospira sp. CH_XMU1458 TaxID=3107776 RepID=UPI00300CE09E